MASKSLLPWHCIKGALYTQPNPTLKIASNKSATHVLFGQFLARLHIHRSAQRPNTTPQLPYDPIYSCYDTINRKRSGARARLLAWSRVTEVFESKQTKTAGRKRQASTNQMAGRVVVVLREFILARWTTGWTRCCRSVPVGPDPTRSRPP